MRDVIMDGYSLYTCYGASMFFIVVYSYITRYIMVHLLTRDSALGCRCSYLLCMIITALWVMSCLGTDEFSGSNVITNLFSAIPFFGSE